jgi:tRNA modification GTPase
MMVATRTPSPDLAETIVALSSAAGPGARAIVRLSGQRSAAIAATLVAGFVRAKARAGHFYEGRLALPEDGVALPVDVYYFAAPHTYTGQDVIELHTLSCPPLVELLIARCLDAGARAAQPGEFTLRAFLAGKLDLTRAEAVLGVIEADSRDELRQALTQLAGGLAEPLRELREDLLSLLADVEAALDFADEDVQFVRADELLRRLAKGLAYLTTLRRQLEQRALGPRPFRAVLAGPPNAGKSSLFNALLGTAAALVSAEPGTTRDYLEETLAADGFLWQLVDTAGLRGGADALEASAQGLGRAQVEQADLVVWCCEAGTGAHELPVWLANYPSTKLVQLATKADLAPCPSHLLATSAVTGAGIEELRQLLAARARQQRQTPLAPSQSRCRHHIEASLGHLRQAHAVVIHEEPPELLALELRLALEELGALVGAIYTDDLLDRIFSRFCIGK